VGYMTSGRKGCKIGNQADFMEPSLLHSQRKSCASHGTARPKAQQGHKYNPLGAQGRGRNRSIHHNSAKPRSKHRRETMVVASPISCLGDGIGLP
jgi:hypothetical protein